MTIASNPGRKPSRVYIRRGHPTTQNLVAAYPFYTGAGTVLRDVSGGNYHGSFTNMTSSNWGAGSPGRYVSFNGSDELIAVPKEALSDMRSNNALSIVALVYNTDLSQDGTVAGQFDNSSAIDDVFLFYMDTGDSDGYRFLVRDEPGEDTATTATSTSTGGAVQDAWQSVAGTWDGTDARVYHDGALSDTATGALVLGSNSVDPAIGANRAGDNARNFPGRIALVLIYVRALSDGEVARLAEDPFLPFITRPR